MKRCIDRTVFSLNRRRAEKLLEMQGGLVACNRLHFWNAHHLISLFMRSILRQL